jgi:hypothetical protein
MIKAWINDHDHKQSIQRLIDFLAPTAAQTITTG